MTDKFKIRKDALLSWLLLPVYVWQGLRYRKANPRMVPPPAKPVHFMPEGWEEGRDGSRQEAIKVLVVGDSSAAGTGVDCFEDSFGGQLLKLLHERTGKPVILRIAGNNSATAAQVRDYVVPNLEREDHDFVFLNIGTNDAKNFHTGAAFKRDFGTLLYALRTRFPNASIIWSGILDLEKLPALPTPLNRVLGARSRLCMHIGKQLCLERGAISPDFNWRIVSENFAVDGFHASSNGYREWAEYAVEQCEVIFKSKQ